MPDAITFDCRCPVDVTTPSKRSRTGRVADLGVDTTGDARGGEDHTHSQTSSMRRGGK